MSRLASSLLLAGVLASGCARESVPPPAAPAGPPDVLLVTIDTFRADRAGCLGNPDGLTPTIDRIARDGRIARDAFSPAPLTAVSHATLLTGLEPPTHGVRENTLFRLDADIPTVASLLRENGFATGGFVSAVPLAARFGFDSGFDVYDDDFGADPGWLSYARRPGSATVDAALKWIATVPPDRRWFLWVHFFDPHYPLAPPPELKKLPVADDYDRAILETDRQLRRLLQALEVHGGGRDPVIAVVSDHGEGRGGHGELSHGLLLYEETMNGLFAMSAPRGTEERARLGAGAFRGVVTYCDLVPTLFDVLDLPLSDPTDGRSLLASADPEGGAYGETYYPAIHYGWSPLLSWRDVRWTYVSGPDPELYDRATDPGEKRNVIAAHPDVAKDLERRIEAKAHDPVPQDARGPAAETRAQMESLGYVSTAGDFSYDSDKDPKKLVGAANALFRGMSLLAQGNAAAAHASFQQAYRIDPDNVTTVAYLGDTFCALGNIATAKDYYRRAVELSPRASSAFAHLAVLEFDGGHRDEAFSLLERGLAAVPDAFSLLVTAGDLYRDSNRPAEAKAMYERATESEPKRPEAWAGLARMAVMRGDRAEGERLWQKAVDLDGSGALRGQTLDGAGAR
jgi:arylsulfatase A-like enzyme/Tfp pilus assembly protein PilF